MFPALEKIRTLQQLKYRGWQTSEVTFVYLVDIMLRAFGVTQPTGNFLERLDVLMFEFVLPVLELETFEHEHIHGHEVESPNDEVRLCYEYVRTVHMLPLITFENYGHNTRAFMHIWQDDDDVDVP